MTTESDADEEASASASTERSAETTGVLLTVAYDGTAFSGWAIQREARTVEETLRGAILAVDPRAAGPRGASRTDAGVHAEGQRAAFDTKMAIPPRGWVRVLNQHLPDDVAVRAAALLSPGFSPRTTSRKKRYRYELLLDKVREPLLRNRAWRIGYDMDMTRLEREAQAIVGTHDFAAFRSAGDARAMTVRTIDAVRVHRLDDDRRERHVAITVEGNSFLYNMVRILVGTLVDVSRGRLEEGAVARGIATRERSALGQTAPAHGLVLESIDVDLPEGGERWPP